MDFSRTKALFDLPEGVIYLDGNSLGAMPRGVPERVEALLREEWAAQLIRGWNACGWMDMPARLGDRVGRLIGAAPGSVVMGDTLSVKVHQALAAALPMRPDRRVILSDSGNFPSDLYMAQGLAGLLGQGHEIRTPDPQDVEAAITDEVAVLMLTEVDYRTGRRHEMARLTAKAHAHGALTIWDLAHSAGAVPVDLAAVDADFAVGCTYKYLNGGPGAPAFIYVAPRLVDAVEATLSGWLGHAEPFAFAPDYAPAPGVGRMRVGTPPVLALAALEVALDIWDEVDMGALRAASVALSERFIAGVEARCAGVTLASPRDATLRGSQVSFRHPQGYAVMQALIAEGVIGDFRQPDIMRFGFTPLYLDAGDIDRAVDILADILATGRWDRPAFHARKAVT
ncbi:kynureninase [Thalassococcus sp. CAU 1522]|uniref:Kynureninase n=1 Tax=Thalassococcus arenae TaxID=2851652 RepID=A0ABS6N3U9_9RHOB|nr:kynureninase [Thalassococcus arenae]MBV2358468.1 kynureninase [Thalassococcus arenae]